MPFIPLRRGKIQKKKKGFTYLLLSYVPLDREQGFPTAALRGCFLFRPFRRAKYSGKVPFQVTLWHSVQIQSNCTREINLLKKGKREESKEKGKKKERRRKEEERPEAGRRTGEAPEETKIQDFLFFYK